VSVFILPAILKRFIINLDMLLANVVRELFESANKPITLNPLRDYWKSLSGLGLFSSNVLDQSFRALRFM
jgi:hypothetical protein